MDYSDNGNKRWAEALAADPIVRCRQLVSSCHASGQRREDFSKTIEDGNSSGVFRDHQDLPV